MNETVKDEVSVSPSVNIVKCFRLTLFAMPILLLAGAALFYSLDDEPRAGGRTLNDWLRSYRQGGDNTEISNAVRRIGVEAIPVLLAKLRAKDPGWKSKLREASSATRILPNRWLYAADYEHQNALRGFSFLGTQAISAIPELSKMLFDPNTALRAATALGSIGPDARPVLLLALNNADPQIRSGAIVGLTVSTEMALAFVADILPSLHDTDDGVARVAARCTMRSLPGPQALEAAVEALRDSRAMVQVRALWSLQDLVRTNRISALPAIVPLLESSNALLRHTATNVFQEISSPQESRRSGVGRY